MYGPLFAVLLWGAFGCGEHPTEPVPSTRAAVATPIPTKAISLSFRPDLLKKLSLPPTSRAAVGPVPDEWAIPWPFRRINRPGGKVVFGVDKPFHVLYFGQGRGKDGERVHLISPTEGMLRPRKRSGQGRGLRQTWSLRKGKLIIHQPRGLGPPKGLRVKVPMATEAERGMNFVTADRPPEAFALRGMPVDGGMVQGLFLPAPSEAVFRVSVPANGQLKSRAYLIRPPVDQGHASDGATVVVTVDLGQGPRTLTRLSLSVGEGHVMAVDLSEYAGKTVDLGFVTEPGDTPTLDYVFLADPVVYAPNPQPRRVLFVLVDTLRADHLGTYGYARDTSANLDAFAAEATVFEQARAPAPWTLPSALAALYGRTPEWAANSSHLGTRFGQAGWATCAVVSNVWLTDPTTLATGWSFHLGSPLAPASRQVERAATCLNEHPDRDVFLFVHMIDMHLPYNEQRRFRGRFAGPPPAGLLGKIGKGRARTAYREAAGPAAKAAVQQHIIDRYDQNLLAVDESFGALLSMVGPNATVVFTADHGEELFQRGDLAHGQSLYDELVRVPLLFRGAGLPAGRVSASVGLMDVAPTLLAHTELPSLEPVAGGVTGRSLVDLIQGRPGETERFSMRALPLGRLWGSDDHWGVVVGQQKWIGHPDGEMLFDVVQDPQEQQNVLRPLGRNDFPDLLSDGLRRPVERVLRISSPGSGPEASGRKASMVVSHPDGVVKAWTRLDPRDEYARPVVVDGVVSLPLMVGRKTPRELFVQLPEGVSAAGLHIGRSDGRAVFSGTLSQPFDVAKEYILRSGDGKKGIRVRLVWQALPQDGESMRVHGEITEELRALGYVE